MEGRTIGWLKADSEGYLCNEVDKTLRWGEKFCRQLQEKTEADKRADQKKETDKKPVVLKDVVYTEIYNKGKIEDWAEYMHKTATEDFVHRMSKDAQLLELAEEYITHDDALYKIIGKGEAK